MNWKEFLRPNIKKIKFFLLIIFALFVLQLLPILGELLILLNPLTYFLYGLGIIHPLSSPLFDPFQLILGFGFLILWYVWSCLIVWIYDRVKKK